MSLRKDAHTLVMALLTAALIGLVGWVYTTGNRVTALEKQDQTIGDKLESIHTDVREIRSWLLPYDKTARH